MTLLKHHLGTTSQDSKRAGILRLLKVLGCFAFPWDSGAASPWSPLAAKNLEGKTAAPSHPGSSDADTATNYHRWGWGYAGERSSFSGSGSQLPTPHSLTQGFFSLSSFYLFGKILGQEMPWFLKILEATWIQILAFLGNSDQSSYSSLLPTIQVLSNEKQRNVSSCINPPILAIYLPRMICRSQQVFPLLSRSCEQCNNAATMQQYYAFILFY